MCGGKPNDIHMPTQVSPYLEPALESVALDNIRKYFRKTQEYERAYREG